MSKASRKSLLSTLYNSYRNNINLKGRVVVFLFVLFSFPRKRIHRKLSLILYAPFIILYKIVTDLVLKCELPLTTQVGDGLRIHHVTGLVINSNAIIGKNVTLSHNVTIGNKISRDGVDLGSPRIGSNVTIGPNSVLIGPVIIGDNVIIGAGSVVVKDVPANTVVAGNPARKISK